MDERYIKVVAKLTNEIMNLKITINDAISAIKRGYTDKEVIKILKGKENVDIRKKN